MLFRVPSGENVIQNMGGFVTLSYCRGVVLRKRDIKLNDLGLNYKNKIEVREL